MTGERWWVRMLPIYDPRRAALPILEAVAAAPAERTDGSYFRISALLRHRSSAR